MDMECKGLFYLSGEPLEGVSPRKVPRANSLRFSFRWRRTLQQIDNPGVPLNVCLQAAESPDSSTLARNRPNCPSAPRAGDGDGNVRASAAASYPEITGNEPCRFDRFPKLPPHLRAGSDPSHRFLIHIAAAE